MADDGPVANAALVVTDAAGHVLTEPQTDGNGEHELCLDEELAFVDAWDDEVAGAARSRWAIASCASTTRRSATR